jgi:hypothetical protein
VGKFFFLALGQLKEDPRSKGLNKHSNLMFKHVKMKEQGHICRHKKTLKEGDGGKMGND